MIFLDANFFLRALILSEEPAIQRMNRIAGDLLRRADRGEVELTTSDAVIAEVAFILTSKAHYQRSVEDAVDRMAVLLRLRGMRLREKRVILEALDLWKAAPKLGFVDALTAAYAQQVGMELATFDRDFDRFPAILRWTPGDDPEVQ